MVTGELLEVGSYLTEQEPRESLHTVRENFPEPLLDHVTFPLGKRPVTVTLHLTGEPTTLGDGEHDKVVEVADVVDVADVVEVVVVPEEAIAGAADMMIVVNEEITRIRRIAVVET